MELLSTKNTKTQKGEKYGYETHIMYLSPYNQNSKGINICSHATIGCSTACLFNSGYGGFSHKIKQNRIRKTELYLSDRKLFLNMLVNELTWKLNKSVMNNFIPVVRLNGTSDIPFEKFKIKDNKNIFELFPDVIFYDYTKNPKRFEKELPKNYTLVFSRSEENEEKCFELLKKGVRVAMVFDKLVETYKDYKVINGDETDLRFLDSTEQIIGLKYKALTYTGVDNNKIKENDFVIKT
jgi:hypothetical protein